MLSYKKVGRQEMRVEAGDSREGRQEGKKNRRKQTSWFQTA